MIVHFHMYGYEFRARVEPEDRSVGLRADVLEVEIVGDDLELEDLEPWIQMSVEEAARKEAGRIT